MQAFRTFLCLVFAASALGLPVAARSQGLAATADRSLAASYPSNGRSYLGLSLGRSQRSLPCGSTALLCDDTDRSSQFNAGTMIGNFWGVAVGYADSGRLAGAGGESRTQGLNVSLVGKAPLGRALGVFGKLGTTYGRSDAFIAGSSLAPGVEQSLGRSYGAGVSYAFTPRLSATLEWDSNDFRFTASGRDPVRSTSLGLQYRY